MLSGLSSFQYERKATVQLTTYTINISKMRFAYKYRIVYINICIYCNVEKINRRTISRLYIQIEKY